jgi:hypothetical protein
MSDRLRLFTEPPPEWTELCRARRSLFHTPAWQTLLARSFKTVPLYALGPDMVEPFALTVFSAGPFRIGYVGFPTGGLMGATPLTAAMVDKLATALSTQKVDLLRLVASPFQEPLLLDYPYEETWETTVPDLSTWQESRLASGVRRDIRKARKTNMVIEEANPSAASFIAHLYRDTVLRHQGTLRYNLNYFRHLLEIAHDLSGLRCWLAVVESQPAAFLTAVREGETVFYLHGAMDREYRQYQPSDLLLFTAIHWAKEEGASQFNMMSSPLNQPSLVRYKEKWGGLTRKQRTYDLPLRPAAAHLFRWLAKGYKLFSGSRFGRWT